MKCKSIDHLIDEFIDGNCDAKITSQVKEHLDFCVVCSDEYASRLQIQLAMSSFPVSFKTNEQWRSIETRILNELDTITPQAKTVSFKTTFSSQLRVAAVLVLFLLASLPFIYFRFHHSKDAGSLAFAPQVISLEGAVELNGVVCSDITKLPEVNVGEVVSTNSNSSAIIKADSGSQLTVKEKSAIRVKAFSKKNRTFQLDYGKVAVNVAKRKDDQLFSIKTRNAVCEVVGTRFSVEFTGDSSSPATVLSVLEGCVRFRTNDGNAILVNSGEQCAINGGSIGKKEISIEKEPRITPEQEKTIEAAIRAGDKKLIDGSRNPNSKDYLPVAEYIKQISGTDSSIDRNDFNGALKKVDNVIATSLLKPDQLYDANMKKARILKLLKRHSDVARVLEAVADGNFRSEYKGNALYQYAMLQKNELNNSVKAADALKKYISDHKDGLMISDAIYSLAEILHEKKDYSGEAAVYNQYIELSGNTESTQRAVYELARLYSTELNDCSRALGLFTHLSDKYPQGAYSEDALFWMAKCLQVQGKVAQAINAYKEYLHRYPEGKWAMDVKARTTARSETGANR
jgi:TolA-binding protein